MKATAAAWAIAVFFGCSIAFAALRRLTQHQSTAVTVIVQIAALAAIVAAVVLVVRHRGDD